MTVTTRPSRSGPSLLGGSIELAPNPCLHSPPTPARPWVGEPGTSGSVAVVGVGKMGLPLAAQFASHGWDVTAVDVSEAVVASINEGRSHIGEEPGVADLVREAHSAGRLRATTDAAAAARDADVVVIIVPVMLDDEQQPDRRAMDAAVGSVAPGLHPGSAVVFESTLPVGDTRSRYAARLAQVTGLELNRELFIAFSPERLYSGAALRNLATYPKLVGGIGPASTARASAFYDSVLDAEVIAMSSAEAAELAKLADTTYRDVNIAFANELARAAERAGADVIEVIEAANSQPYSHIHRPGLGVGGHCIPVYPHLLLAGAPDLELVTAARRINDGQVGLAVRALQRELGPLEAVPILVLGLTYREGVRELAYSRALPLIDRLGFAGAVVSAFDPLLGADEVARLGAAPWEWGSSGAFRAIVTQTGDPRWLELDPEWFPALELILDGRNSLGEIPLRDGVRHLGIGIPARP